MKIIKQRWIPVEERFPKVDKGSFGKTVLLSFSNYPEIAIGDYRIDFGGGAFYPCDSDRSYASFGVFVNAWMPLPEPYREEGEE